VRYVRGRAQRCSYNQAKVCWLKIKKSGNDWARTVGKKGETFLLHHKASSGRKGEHLKKGHWAVRVTIAHPQARPGQAPASIDPSIIHRCSVVPIDATLLNPGTWDLGPRVGWGVD